jgi:uncharacterized Zn finger protein
MTDQINKTCNTCGETKSTQLFHRHKRGGVQYQCKSCWSVREKAGRSSKSKAYRAAAGSVVAAQRRSPYKPSELYGGATYTEAVTFTIPFAEERLRLEAETGGTYHIDHIVAISLGGKHVVSNLQVISQADNIRKAQEERDLTQNPYRTKRQPSPLKIPF